MLRLLYAKRSILQLYYGCITITLRKLFSTPTVFKQLNECDLLSPEQHGFRKYHSYESQLIIIDDFGVFVDAGAQIDTMLLDF